MAELNIGDLAPNFTLPKDGGGEVSLAALRGKTVVLYFYPKDDTSGCTNQAIQFSEKKDEFEDKNAIIIGVSKDSIKSHDKFKAKYDLKIDLLSDEELDAANAYGTWVEKSMYGRKYMGMDRSTFLIDADGKIKKICRKVKIPGHIDDVIKSI
ncbi:MAG: thioredoxin-dependent thiol peroxidase [Caulobacterales bacterium]|nr:thioredoxin-dependent thiol peroxidase [Caulobacterales bacterium]MCA0373082.1 thioredoxin-dependent thiol peroxidase [Pseudomonadota bacterium]